MANENKDLIFTSIQKEVFMKKESNFAIKNLGNFDTLTRVAFNEILNLSGIEVSINKINAGESSPFVHAHKRNEEVYIFLKGKGIAYVDGEEFLIREGDVIRIDLEGRRAFKADDLSDLNYICIQAETSSLIQHTGKDGYPVEENPSWK